MARVRYTRPTIDAPGRVRKLPPARKNRENAVVAISPTKNTTMRGGKTKDGRSEPNIPKGKLGNSAGDQKFLEDVYQTEDIEEILDDEPNIPFGAKLRFTGALDAIDATSYWKLPPVGSRCNSLSKVRDNEGRPILNKDNQFLVRPCSKPAIHGGTVCMVHGGGRKAVQKAAEMRLLNAADSVIGALIGIALDTKQDAKARVQAINSVLDRAGIKGGSTITLDIPAYKEIAKDLFEKRYGDE
jgi:hypothetical protein